MRKIVNYSNSYDENEIVEVSLFLEILVSKDDETNQRKCTNRIHDSLFSYILLTSLHFQTQNFR